MKNGKGITWLTPDCAIPGEQRINQPMGAPNNAYGGYNFTGTASAITTTSRFPANLLVQDNILDDYSRYFLEAWASTLPFLITPKPSKAEKNEGLSHLPVKQSTGGGGPSSAHGSIKARGQNFHPTVKPLKLMCYLITLGSRQGDTVLEPFMGSGTTCLAAKHLNRNYIGIEREKEYVDIATARLNNPAPVQATLIASK